MRERSSLWHTGTPSCSHSIHPRWLCSPAVALRTRREGIHEHGPPRPHTRAAVPRVSRCTCTCREHPKRSGAAQLGHEVQGSAALAAVPSSHLETPECVGLPMERGAGHLQPHPPPCFCSALTGSPRRAGERFTKGNRPVDEAPPLHTARIRGLRPCVISRGSLANFQEFCKLVVKHSPSFNMKLYKLIAELIYNQDDKYSELITA